MKTYTLFFPDPESAPSGLVFSDGFVVGDGMLIDGIAVSLKERTRQYDAIVLGEYPDGVFPREVIFDDRRPPEILSGYVFDAEFQQEGQSIGALQSQTPTRHRDQTASPVMVRVHTQCRGDSKLHGSTKIFGGTPRLVALGIGYNQVGTQSSGIWQDALFEMHVGDGLQVRPGGLAIQKEWVLSYKEIGLTHGSLESFVG